MLVSLWVPLQVYCGVLLQSLVHPQRASDNSRMFRKRSMAQPFACFFRTYFTPPVS
jgi:hypothetical protein